jgi:hypothetical protein
MTLPALLIGDGALASAAFSGRIGVLPAIGLHVVLVAAVAVVVMRAGVADWAPSLIALAAVLLAGPAAALAIVLVSAIGRHADTPSGLLDGWYARLAGEVVPDEAQRIAEAIETARAVRPGETDPRPFADILRKGTLAEKQAMLGLIGLRYQPEYLPFLRAALRSPEAVVRAQAAAVLVKLKDVFKQRLMAGLAEARTDFACPLDRAQDLIECASSGFVEPVEAHAALHAAKALCSAALHGPATARAELLLCRALAAGDEHAEVVARLERCADSLPSPLRQAFATSLLALGRHRQLGALLRGGRDVACPQGT